LQKRLENSISIKPLGQTGFKFTFDRLVVYIDPYLTDSVAEVEGTALRRMVPSPIGPEQVKDADLILITHIHQDHCDAATLLPINQASPKCNIICPNEVSIFLVKLGIKSEKITVAGSDWITINDKVKILPVPAAHPVIEKDTDNFYRSVSYIIEYGTRRIYHAGDTSADDELIRILKEVGDIEVAFLPVNEKNYFREKQRIIGNMSVREAFEMATELGVRTFVPTHWDLFAPNSVYREEIELLYRLIRPPFQLLFNPNEI
jgi:L-ascorbate 6-phosphate lactonase